MEEYNSGDIVRVFYPFKPKALSNDSDEHVGKKRFGLIVNAGNNQTMALPILQISSHQGKTEQPDYELRFDEIKVPESVTYYKRSVQEMVPVYGVIKTERIEFFDDDEISRPLTRVELDTKIEVLDKYKDITRERKVSKILDKESPNHKKAMERFERTIIAEKLQFLTTDLGNCRYEHVEDKKFNVNKIQSLGKSDENKRIRYYAVELTSKDNKDSFFYTFSTMKKESQIARDWGIPKPAAEWLKEDERFYNLKKDLHKTFEDTPNPHPAKYKSFSSFKQNMIENIQER